MQGATWTGVLRTNGTDSLVKDVFEALLRQRGALEELDGAYLLCNRDALLVREWLHATAWVMSECMGSVSHSTVRWSRLSSMGVNGRHARVWGNVWGDTRGNVGGVPNCTRQDNEWIWRRRTGHGAYRSSQGLRAGQAWCRQGSLALRASGASARATTAQYGSTMELYPMEKCRAPCFGRFRNWVD